MGPMLWRRFNIGDLDAKAAAFRRTHERWLTRALRGEARAVRIPVRRVDEGGFDALRARRREAADRWWRRVLLRVDDGG